MLIKIKKQLCLYCYHYFDSDFWFKNTIICNYFCKSACDYKNIKDISDTKQKYEEEIRNKNSFTIEGNIKIKNFEPFIKLFTKGK